MSDAILLAAALGCTERSAGLAAAAFRRKAVPRGHVLAHPDAECRSCWLIVDGLAALSAYGADGQLARLNSYGPGELAGACPLPAAPVGELAAEVATDLLEADAKILSALAGEVPEVGRGLAALLSRQMERLLGRMSSQMTLSATGRVYAELIACCDADGRIAPPPVLAALALRVNTARETASRAVAAAERRGLVRRTADALTIVSVARLRDLVV